MKNAPEMIAPMVVYLATDDAWNVNGQIFSVTGGQIGVLAHPVPGRTIYKRGTWTLDELDSLVPYVLMKDERNPAPPAPDLPVPGRTPLPESRG